MNFLEMNRSSRRARNNPLLLPKIVNKTVDYLGFKELLACRQVNKVWNEAATKLLVCQDKCIVTVPGWLALEKFGTVVLLHKRAFPTVNLFTAVRLGSEVSLSDRSNQLAIRKLAGEVKHLELLNAKKLGPTEWNWILFDQFVNLKELHFHGHVPLKPLLASPVWKSAKQGIHKELANLTKLVFNVKNRKSEDVYVRRFLRDMFNITPNLKFLEWIKEDPFANDFQNSMFDCLMINTKPGGPGQLQTFNCPSLVCGTKELQDIEDREFPLREIHFQVAELSAQYLSNFLEIHGATLQKIYLEFYPGSLLNVIVNSPKSGLVQLQELSLTEYRRSIGFVGCLPNLKKLTLTRTNVKRALISIGCTLSSKDDKRLSLSLEQLYVYNDYLSRGQGNCTREIVLKLSQLFPNLKTIRMEGLDDCSLRHLFKSFGRLEELYAPGGTYTDEAFLSHKCRVPVSHGGSRVSFRQAHSKCSVLQLKNLRTLEVESIGLTDMFITHGIVDWPNLRNLTVKYCRISNTALARILMDMDLLQLSFHQCTFHAQGVFGLSVDLRDATQEDAVLNLDYHLIHKWRLQTFQLLFGTRL